jgi:type 1 glutamine amidotransferase
MYFNMKELTVIGSTDGKWHPIDIIKTLGETIGDYKLVYTDDYDHLFNLKEHPMLINFLDLWEMPLNEEQAKALKEYLADGGKILSIHTGISIQDTPEMMELHGAHFTGHPDYCELSIKLVPGHPVTDELDDFEISDEPYYFVIKGPITLLANYEHDGNIIPAAWEHKFGKGTLIYLMPGHDKASIENKQYRKLIESSIRYLESI